MAYFYEKKTNENIKNILKSRLQCGTADFESIRNHAVLSIG